MDFIYYLINELLIERKDFFRWRGFENTDGFFWLLVFGVGYFGAVEREVVGDRVGGGRV